MIIAAGGRNRFHLVLQSLQDRSRSLYTQILWLPCIWPSGGPNQTVVFQRLSIRLPTGCLSRFLAIAMHYANIFLSPGYNAYNLLHELSFHHHRLPTLNGIAVTHSGVYTLKSAFLGSIFRLIAIGHATSGPTISSSCYNYALRPHQYTHRIRFHIYTPHILGNLIAITPNTPILAPINSHSIVTLYHKYCMPSYARSIQVFHRSPCSTSLSTLQPPLPISFSIL